MQAALLYLTLTLFFFAPGLMLGKAFLPAGFLYRTPLWYDAEVPLGNFDLFDAIIYFYPVQKLLGESLRQGELPTWSPYNLGGHPIMHNGQSGYLYIPRLLLHLAFPTALAHGMSLSLHVFLAGFLMNRLARRLGMSQAGALFTGVAWMFNGYAMVWLEFDHVVVCWALIPAGLLALELTSRSRAGIVPLSLAVGLLLTSGHLQYITYALLIIVTAGAYLLRTPKAVLRAGSGLLLGATLAAPVLLPSARLMLGSQRPVLDLGFLVQTYRDFLVTSLPTFLFPDAYGNPVNGFGLDRITLGGNFIYSELCLYGGVATLLLALKGATLPGYPRYLAALGIVALLLPATPLFGLVYLLPGLNRVIATRMIMMTAFCMVVCAGYGLDRLERVGRCGRLSALAVGLAAVSAVALGLLHRVSDRELVAGWIQRGLVRSPDRELFLDDQAFRAAVWEGFHRTYDWSSPSVWMPLAWLLLFAAAVALRRHRARALTALVAVDLMAFGLRYNPVARVEQVYPTTPAIAFLQERLDLERVLGVGTIKPNTLLPFRLLDVGGYDSFYPRHSGEYLGYLMTGSLSAAPAQVFPITRYRSGLVDLMGVRYLVAYPGEKLDLPLVDATQLPIYENPSRLPRAFVAPRYRVVEDALETLRGLDERRIDPRLEVLLPAAPPEPVAQGSRPGTARIVRYGLHQVELEVDAPDPGLLVLTDAFSPGWTAQVDGRQAPLLRADWMFRAVPVPAGRHRVVMEYRPPGLALGCALAAGAALGLGLLAWLELRRGRR